jgi:tRNA 2-selenouridine synthase
LHSDNIAEIYRKTKKIANFMFENYPNWNLLINNSSIFNKSKFLDDLDEEFENNLAMQWYNIDANAILWLENESRMIGTVRIPPKIFEAMRSATTYDIQISLGLRIQHIAKEYGKYDVKILEECTRKLEKKLGNLRMQQAIDFLLAKDVNSWIFMLLEYYDSSYLFSKEKRNPNTIMTVDVKHDASFEEIAQLLVAFQNI